MNGESSSACNSHRYHWPAPPPFAGAAGATQGLGQRDREDAEISQLGPARRDPLFVVARAPAARLELAYGTDRPRPFRPLADRLGQRQLLGGDGDRHCSSCCCGAEKLEHVTLATASAAPARAGTVTGGAGTGANRAMPTRREGQMTAQNAADLPATLAGQADGEFGSAAQRERRKRILDATLTLASKGGYDAVQMREVADRADVALGTLYRYFPSKIHLLVSALASEFERTKERLGR